MKEYNGDPNGELQPREMKMSVIKDSKNHQFRERRPSRELGHPQMKFGLANFRNTTKLEGSSLRRDGQVQYCLTLGRKVA